MSDAHRFFSLSLLQITFILIYINNFVASNTYTLYSLCAYWAHERNHEKRKTIRSSGIYAYKLTPSYVCNKNNKIITHASCIISSVENRDIVCLSAAPKHQKESGDSKQQQKNSSEERKKKRKNYYCL